MIGNHRVTRGKIHNSCDVLLSVPFSNTECSAGPSFMQMKRLELTERPMDRCSFPIGRAETSLQALKGKLSLLWQKGCRILARIHQYLRLLNFLHQILFGWMMIWLMIQPAPCSTTDITDFVVRNQPRPHLSFQVRKNWHSPKLFCRKILVYETLTWNFLAERF